LKEAQIEGSEPPPWGEAKPPPELPLVEGKPVVHGTEAPGEALRRQARELIDGIAAIDLPSAIAFLEFLRDRSGQLIASQDGSSAHLEPDPDDDEPVSLSDPGGAGSSKGAARTAPRAANLRVTGDA
jgi:hypothetical protein